jgi:hypothetical protein
MLLASPVCNCSVEDEAEIKRITNNNKVQATKEGTAPYILFIVKYHL